MTSGLVAVPTDARPVDDIQRVVEPAVRKVAGMSVSFAHSATHRPTATGLTGRQDLPPTRALRRRDHQRHCDREHRHHQRDQSKCRPAGHDSYCSCGAECRAAKPPAGTESARLLTVSASTRRHIRHHLHPLLLFEPGRYVAGEADLHRPGVGRAAGDNHAGQVRVAARARDDEPGQLDRTAGQ